MSASAVPGYPNPPPPGLNQAVAAAGVHLYNEGGIWMASDPIAAATIAASYDPAPFVVGSQMAAAADARWTRMSGGYTTPAGIPLSTDSASITMLTGVAVAASSASVGTSFPFKDRTGAFHQMTPSDVRALYGAVVQFIQSCYAAEANIRAQINAPGQTWQQVQAIDVTAGLPANS